MLTSRGDEPMGETIQQVCKALRQCNVRQDNARDRAGAMPLKIFES